MNVIHIKEGQIRGLHRIKKRTEVLYTNNKVDMFWKKRRKNLDFFKVKILQELSENVKKM